MNAASIDPLTLPSVPLEMRSLIPSQLGIYFAIDTLHRVQYIGQSANLLQRWLHHHRYNELSSMTGVRIAWLEVSSPELLPEIEKALINWFQPSLNGKTTLGLERKLQAVTAYLTPELKQVLEEWAEEESRSLSRHIVHLLTQAAKEYQQAKEQK